MDRFSMNEFKPLSLDEKKARLENQNVELQNEKNKYIERKKEIEVELSMLNSEIRKGEFENGRYVEICNTQDKLKVEKFSLEKKILELNQRIRNKSSEETNIKLQIKRIPNEKVKHDLLELRDKYMSFASDTTRVSSMRAMASRFVEEIQFILKHIPN